MLKIYNQLKDLFEDKLQESVMNVTPNTLYDPIRYMIMLGGKRLRPVLCLMGCRLYSDDCEKAIPAALAIEMFHNFTLIHDDIIDNSPLRRGHPTVFKKWDINTAILSGDVLFAKAFEYISKITVPNFRDIMQVFATTAIQVCEGQRLDMDYERIHDVSMQQYIDLITLKTAVLIANSLKIGSMIVGCSERQLELIYKFGLNAGIVFQLQDDYLDIFADEKSFGKHVGHDIQVSKKTFPFIKTMELLNYGDKEEFYVLYTTPTTNPNEKIDQVKKIYDDLNIHVHVEETIRKYHNKSLEYLFQIDGDLQIKQELEELANSLLMRKN